MKRGPLSYPVRIVGARVSNIIVRYPKFIMTNITERPTLLCLYHCLYGDSLTISYFFCINNLLRMRKYFKLVNCIMNNDIKIDSSYETTEQHNCNSYHN